MTNSLVNIYGILCAICIMRGKKVNYYLTLTVRSIL